MTIAPKRAHGEVHSICRWDRRRMVRFALAATCLCSGLPAQRDAVLTGTIKDPQGAAVRQAQVRLFRQDTGSVLQTVTTDNGEYSFERLTAGVFILEVEKASFRGATIEVRVDAGSARADVTLDLAGVNQSVIVTAAGVPQQLDEIAKAVSTVSGDEIRNRNEYALSDIVRSTPGMLITSSGSPGQNINIRLRGLRPDATAVLVDGLRFRDATTLQGDASSVMPTLNFIAADRVEVLRGSGSSLYGTNAVGGVVNVVTQQGGSPLHGQLQGEGGNMGFFRGRGTVGGGAFNDRLKYTAGLLHLNIAKGVDGNDSYRSTGGQGFLRYDLAPAMTISGRLWASDDFVQLNQSPTTFVTPDVSIPASNFPATGIVPARILSPENVAIINSGGVPDMSGATLIPGRDDPDYHRDSRFYTGAVIFRHEVTPRASWQASYQRVHTRRVFRDGPDGTGFQPVGLNLSNYSGDIDTADVRGTALVASWMSVTGGYEFEREGYFEAQKNNLPAPETLSAETRIQQKAHAGYFAAQLGLLDRKLQVSVSGRAQMFRLSKPEFQLTGAANNYDRVPITDPAKALTGDVAVAYLLTKTNTKFRAHGGNAYRAPSLYERFGGGFSTVPGTGVVMFTPYGDPRLNPDRYNSVDGGIDQYLFQNRVRVSATMFYSRVVSISAFDFSGVVQPDTDPYGRSAGYINGSGGISRGFELSLEARPMRSLTLNSSYTYTNANMDRDISVPGFWGVLGVPRHMATLVAVKQWTRRLDTTVDIFTGSGYFSPFFAVDRSRAFGFPGFTKVDLTASYRFWERERKTARLYGKVDNIFNKRYYQNGWLASQATFVVGIGAGF